MRLAIAGSWSMVTAACRLTAFNAAAAAHAGDVAIVLRAAAFGPDDHSRKSSSGASSATSICAFCSRPE